VSTGPFRVGVDVGGTFTDFALVDDASGAVTTHKQLTTPHDPAEAVLEGVAVIAAAAGLAVADLDAVIHGTTLVTNAVIERKGVPTAMLVTEGFRDTLDIARERRYDLFDLRIRFPDPIVPRRLRLEVAGRILADGTQEVALRLDDDLEMRLRTLVRQEGVQSVAVCFLHSYLDPSHEDRAAAWLRDRFPDLTVSTSASVFPFMREYERWTTAVINASVQPVVDRYIARIQDGLSAAGFGGRFLVMSSSGGTLSPDLARRYPVRMLESGPAAGALMAARHGDALDRADLLAFDMGGTTAKGCAIRDGAPLRRYELEVARVHDFKPGSGLPVKIPVLDMIEIGAGGGSIAGLDDRGMLRVGPRSAGASPGPACYGRGGERPTLTDANLVLGYLSADSFLGGRMRLDVDAARHAIRTHVAEPLGLDVERAAWGIHEVISEDVGRAFRMHASERGIDYRRCAMVAFGGSGPIHAVGTARKLRIPQVVCPWRAGVMSAFGLLASPLSFEIVRSRRRALDDLDEATFAGPAADLAEAVLAELAAAGVERGNARLSLRLDMRYEGQGHEIEIAVPDGAGLAGLRERFDAAYRAVFGLAFADRPVEIVNWKMEGVGPEPPTGMRSPYRRPDAPAASGTRAVYEPGRGFVPWHVYKRAALVAGDVVQGPALVEEDESTVVIGTDDRASVDALGHLIVSLGGLDHGL